MQWTRRSEGRRTTTEPPDRWHAAVGRITSGRRGASLGVLAVTLLVVLSAVSLGVGVTTAAGGTTKAGVESCQTINSSGTYTLTKDITDYNTQSHPSKDICFFIDASGVTLDGQGHTINIHDTAIFVKGDDVTVENVVIERGSGDPSTGIRYDHASDGKITGNEIRDLQTGIDVVDWGNHDISGNTIEGMTAHGIHLRGQTTDNTLSGNEVRDNQKNGITLQTGATDNEITGNEITGNQQDGIEIINDRNVVTGNTIKNNDLEGVSLDTASGVEIRNNDIVDNGRRGIELDASDDNEVLDNRIEDNAGSGIYVYQSDRNLVKNNDVIRNYDGIELDEATETEIRDNVVTDNVDNGTFVHFSSDGNGFFHNEFDDNDEYGIAVENSDGNKFVDNSALDNGEAAFYAAGSGKTDAWDLEIGPSSEPVAIGFRDASGVVISTTEKPPDGPNPNEVDEDTDTDDSDDGFVETPGGPLDPDVQTALTESKRRMAEHMNVSDKAKIHKYVKVEPAGSDHGLEMLRIYYDNDDLNCNVESDLAIWRYSPPQSPAGSGVWRTSFMADDRGTTGSSVNLQGFGSVSMDSWSYVEASNHSGTDGDLLTFQFVDHHVFAGMSDVQSGCTPTAYSPPEDESSPGFGLAAAVIAVLVVISRRLLDGS